MSHTSHTIHARAPGKTCFRERRFGVSSVQKWPFKAPISRISIEKRTMNSNELSRPKSPRTRTIILYGAGGTAAAAAAAAVAAVAVAAVLVAAAAVAMRAAARAVVAARSVGATAVAVHGGGDVARWRW